MRSHTAVRNSCCAHATLMKYMLTRRIIPVHNIKSIHETVELNSQAVSAVLRSWPMRQLYLVVFEICSRTRYRACPLPNYWSRY